MYIIWFMILQIRQIIDNVLKYTAGNAHQNTHKNSAIYKSILFIGRKK